MTDTEKLVELKVAYKELEIISMKIRDLEKIKKRYILLIKKILDI